MAFVNLPSLVVLIYLLKASSMVYRQVTMWILFQQSFDWPTSCKNRITVDVPILSALCVSAPGTRWTICLKSAQRSKPSIERKMAHAISKLCKMPKIGSNQGLKIKWKKERNHLKMLFASVANVSVLRQRIWSIDRPLSINSQILSSQTRERLSKQQYPLRPHRLTEIKLTLKSHFHFLKFIFCLFFKDQIRLEVTTVRLLSTIRTTAV